MRFDKSIFLEEPGKGCVSKHSTKLRRLYLTMFPILARWEIISSASGPFPIWEERGEEWGVGAYDFLRALFSWR